MGDVCLFVRVCGIVGTGNRAPVNIRVTGYVTILETAVSRSHCMKGEKNERAVPA